MLRSVLACLIGLAAASASADEPPVPLFTHSDSGEVRVMHGDSGDTVPLQSAGSRVQAFVARANALLGRDAAAAAEALSEAIAEGRELQARLETGLAGKLYLEEATRRLKRLRLSRVPVAETEVVRAGRAQYPERLSKPLDLRRGVDDLGVSYATFAACLERAAFPADPGPRQVHLADDGALWARVNGQPLAFDIIAYGDDRLMVRSVIIGATRSLGFKDKLQIARFVLDRCA